MAAKNDVTIAYNGYVIGGESSIAKHVGEVRVDDESYPRMELSLEFVITATSGSELDSETDTARSKLRAKSKNFGITFGERITGADGVANGTTTFTSAAALFAATDVGLPINIEGRGAYQIVTFNSATSVVLSGTVTTGTGLTWRVGYEFVRVVPSGYTTGFFVRCSVGKPGSDEDTILTRKLRWRIGFELPADNANDNYRREAQISIAYSGSRQRVVTFTGTYTTGGGNTALANYLASFAAWKTTWLTTVSSTATWEKIEEGPVQVDDENGVLTFMVRYREILADQTLAGTDDGSIVRDVIDFVRTQVLLHGRSGEVAAVRGRLSYACEVDVTVTTLTGLKVLYTGKIKPFLLSKATTIFGGSVVIEKEDLRFAASSNAIASSMDVLLLGLGSSVLEYNEQVAYRKDEKKTRRKKWDGRPDTYYSYSPGHRITATRTISQLEVTGAGSSEQTSSSQRITVGARQGAPGVNINFGGDPARDTKGSGGTSTLFDKPPARFGAAGDGFWDPDDDGEVLARDFVGADVDAQGSVRPRLRSVTSQSFTWVSGSSSGSGKDRVQTSDYARYDKQRNPTYTQDPASVAGKGA